MKSEWLTIAASALRRVRYIAPQIAPSVAGDDRGVPALQRVAQAEGEAGDEQAQPRPAEIAAKAVQQERALQLLAHAAGDDHDAPGTASRLTPVPSSASSGLSGTLCSARHEASNRRASARSRRRSRAGNDSMPSADLAAAAGRPPKNTSAGRSPRRRSSQTISAEQQHRVDAATATKTNAADSAAVGVERRDARG